MRSRDDLFHLIKSMSKSEKRYFILDARKGGREASRYLQLFEALNSMEKLDEEALKTQFPKNLSSDKAYLYEAILRSMRDYRSPASKAAQVKERLMDARFLYERGLYDQSTQRIADAKAMATELQDNFTLLEINKEEQVSLFDRKAKVELEHIEKLKAEQKVILEAIQEELKFIDIHYRLGLEAVKEFNLKDDSSIEGLKELVPIDLLNEKNTPYSSLALHRFYLCNAFYHNLRGELNLVYAYFLKAAEWWEQFPVLKSEEFHRYIINVSNLVNTAYKIDKNIPVIQVWLDKIEREKNDQSYHNQKLIFLYISISSLLRALNEGKFQEAYRLLPEIISGVNKFGLKKSLVLTGNIITVYFLVKDYLECIKWVDIVLKTSGEKSREDIQRIIRIYKIISYYELGKIAEVEAEIRSANRLFKLMSLKKGQFEDLVLNTYLKNIINAPINEQKNAIIAFNSFLTAMQNEVKMKNTLGLDELIIWTQQKLTPKSMRLSNDKILQNA